MILKEILKKIEQVEKSKNDLCAVMYLFELKNFVLERLKYNRPDIIVCDSCRSKGGNIICEECEIGSKFIKEEEGK